MTDLLVLGGGPAGMAAAIAASESGLKTVLIDDQPSPGGQVYRNLPPGWQVADGAALGPDYQAGQALRDALDDSAVTVMSGLAVWNVRARFTIDAVDEAGHAGHHTASALVLATGATERIIPFPGWTLPGVIGLAGATILLKSQRILPGAHTVVAGVGPLLYAVAAGIVKGGGTVVAVVDAAERGEWLRLLPALASQPKLLARGLRWMALLRRAGVPILPGHAVVAASGGHAVQSVSVARLGHMDEGFREFEVDSVAVGHGLVPATEAARLLQAAMAFDAAEGVWAPAQDAHGRTSIPRLYVAGDGAGIAGAIAAERSGTLAGLAAAQDLGCSRIAKAAMAPARFGKAVAGMMRRRAALASAITPATVVCRCEDVDRARIDAAITRGARTLNQVKSWTRCGMGPCQGRFCSEATALLIAAHTGDAEAAGQITARVPLRPVSVAALSTGFDYARDVPAPVLVPR